MLLNQWLDDMYSEGESDSAVADQNVKIVSKVENILNFYISRAH